MKVISIISQKGGVGKTTLATCLSVAAEQDGKSTVIYDLDPQATASFWKDIRKKESPAVVSLQSVRLQAMIKAAEEAGTDLVIIDGAAVARDIAFEAARVADFVLIPTKAAVFDTMSMLHTIEVVQQQGKDFSIVLNFVPPSGQEITDAISAAEQLNAPICPISIGNRKAYFRAQSQGLGVQEYEPSGKAAKEILDLYKYTCMHVYKEEEMEEDGELIASGA